MKPGHAVAPVVGVVLVVGLGHRHPLDRIRLAEGAPRVHVRVELALDLQRLEGARGVGERLSSAQVVRRVPVQTGADRAERVVRFEAAVLGHVDDPGALHGGLVRAPARLRDRDRGHRAVGGRVDLEDVAVLLAVEALDHLLAGDPDVRAAQAAGAVGGGAAEDREVPDDLVRRAAAPDAQLGVAAEGRGVVLERRAGDDLLLARALAVLVVADQDRRAACARVGAHAVEDPRRRVPVAHRGALARDDLVVEVSRQPDVALVHERAVAVRARLSGCPARKRAERPRRHQPASHCSAPLDEGAPRDRAHPNRLPVEIRCPGCCWPCARCSFPGREDDVKVESALLSIRVRA